MHSSMPSAALTPASSLGPPRSHGLWPTEVGTQPEQCLTGAPRVTGRVTSPSSSWARRCGPGSRRGRCTNTGDSGGPGHDHGRAAATASTWTAPLLAAGAQALPLLPAGLAHPGDSQHPRYMPTLHTSDKRSTASKDPTATGCSRSPPLQGPDSVSCPPHVIGQSIQQRFRGPSGFRCTEPAQPKHSLSPSDRCAGDRREDSLSALRAPRQAARRGEHGRGPGTAGSHFADSRVFPRAASFLTGVRSLPGMLRHRHKTRAARAR